MYAVELSQKANKFLRKLDKSTSERIIQGLKKLNENPVPSDARFLGRDGDEKVFRFRIDDYRALYKVKEDVNVILIAKIDKRSRIYSS